MGKERNEEEEKEGWDEEEEEVEMEQTGPQPENCESVCAGVWT